MWWNGAVPVHLRPGRTDQVTSPRRAAEILVNEWPAGADTARQRAARRAVLKALENMNDAKAAAAARKAFAAAVDEAGLTGAKTDSPPVTGKTTRWRRR